MTTIAIHTPGQPRTLSFGDWQRLLHRVAVLRRLWRRRHAKRSHLTHILRETADPKLLEDAGIAPLPSSSIENWARTMLYHQQH